MNLKLIREVYLEGTIPATHSGAPKSCAAAGLAPVASDIPDDTDLAGKYPPDPRLWSNSYLHDSSRVVVE